MSNLRVTRVVVAAWAIAAMVSLSTLPAEHLHAPVAGGALVHRHVVHHPAEHAGTEWEHGDHATARTLNPAFDCRRPFDLDRPLTRADVLRIAPEQHSSGALEPTDDPLAHGPPIRIRSLRAPPA